MSCLGFVYAWWSSASASGNGTNPPFKFKKPVSLKAGKNEIALLSMTVGLQVSFSSFGSADCFDCKTLISSGGAMGK